MQKFRIGAAACIAIACLGSTSAQTEAPTKPNVIMIFTDDMGYSDISSFSNTNLPVLTPNIDRLATEGMKFTHFYVAMPICSPSRASVLSGRFAPETGLTNYLQERSGNNASQQNDYMDPELSYLPKTFQAAGYATAHVGKWHLGGGRDVDNAPSIREYGYDEAVSTWESPNPDPGLGIKFTPWNFGNTEPGQVPRYKRTEYMVNKTLDFLQRHPDEPCFVTLWPDDMHTPFTPSPEMRAKYGAAPDEGNTRKTFYGVLEEYDRQIGRLLDGLQAQGIENNTIIFFTGDNGPAPDFGRERTNGMNGNKLSLYEGGIRQPFVIRWPGHIPAGTTNAQTVLSSVDLLPTLAGLADIEVSPEALAVNDGEDLSAAMLGTPITRTKPLMWEYGRTSNVPRPGPNDVDRSPILAIREGDYKLLLNPDNTGHELYNVRTDPDESDNLALQHPITVQAMAAKVLAWRATLPQRSQPYPVFGTVNFNQFIVTHIATESEIRTAAGADFTGENEGVAIGPNGSDDVYTAHVDNNSNTTFLSIDSSTGEITEITDTARILQDLGVTTNGNISVIGGFDYSAPGDRLFFGDQTLVAESGESVLLSIDVGTGAATLVERSSDLGGMSDFSVLPDGELAITRGVHGGNVIGTLYPVTGQWTEKLNHSDLVAAAPGTSELYLAGIGANSSTGEVIVGANRDNELFRIPDISQGSPTVARITPAELDSVTLYDIVVDQAGNIYAYDGFNQANRVVIIRKTDNAIFSVDLADIVSRIGGTAKLRPQVLRGLAARMVDATHADLFIASSFPDYGIIRVRFGTVPAAVHDWTLY